MGKCKLEITDFSTSAELGNCNMLLKIWDDFHPDDCRRHIGVRAASLPSGFHGYEWDASQVASGVYLYRLTAGEYVETKKMVLMK